ncbi:MAG: phosphatase PAP2 family protein [Spirochaetaceae bacterium]|nr:phosphatase PAP2 family protein [Spirochaetaceae bacterium]
MKKLSLIYIIIFTSVSNLFAGGSSQFQLEKNKEIILLSTGAGIILTGAVLKSFSSEPKSTPVAWLTYPSTPYNGNLASASNYLLAAGVTALPFLIDSLDWNEAATLGVMYVETLSITWGVKESLKAVFTKNRPYTAYSDTPIDLLTSEDRYYSFPSGHTSVAFTTAGFATSIFAVSDASPLMKYLFGGANFALASGVAAFRVTSGEHYLVDVLAGALLGTASGILIPYLHYNGKNNKTTSLFISPNTVALNYSY